MGFTGRIASLFNEVFDNAMEQHSLIFTGLAKFYKIIPVQWRIIIKKDSNVAHRCFHCYINRLRGVKRFIRTGSEGKQDE